ncbi:MAG TPA: hypothetical protein VFC21_09250, partial [Bryobacteraceae bacterium]|nr:hypothetical protein [Bryobacteraceae bacterium]
FPAGNGRLTARISSTPPIPARVIKLAPGLSSATGSQRPRPAISNEPLGTRTIEGVLAEGVKTTTVWPVEYFGNDRPITAVRETWTSREIGMAVLIRTSDPRSGETTEKLTNISRDEPALSLFQPPADYQIVDPPAQTGQQ